MTSEQIKKAIARKTQEIKTLRIQLAKFGETENEIASLDKILSATAEQFGVTVPQILSNSQRQLIVCARATMVHIAYNYGYSFVQIGNAINRNHATMIYHNRNFETRYKNYPEHAAQMQKTLNHFKISI